MWLFANGRHRRGRWKNHSHNKVCLVNSVNEFLVAQGNEFYEVEAIAQP